jgi:hypothetical protein
MSKAKARIVIVLNRSSTAVVTDITHSSPDDCDRARRVIEATRALLGLGADETAEDSPGGPGQVEEGLLPQKLKH